MHQLKGSRNDTRQGIIEAALENFRTKGVEGTVLSEVMQTASVKQGSFYYHFESKEELVRETLVFSLNQTYFFWKSALGRDGLGFIQGMLQHLDIAHQNQPH